MNYYESVLVHTLCLAGQTLPVILHYGGAVHVSAANRDYHDPLMRNVNYGFRLARSAR